MTSATATMGATIQAPASVNSGGTALGDWSLPMQNDPTLGPNPSGLCMCGCGAKTAIATRNRADRGWVEGTPKRFLPTHRIIPTEPLNPSGLCMCGCGKPAPISTKSDMKQGYIRGQASRFIAGHHGRGVKASDEARRAMSESRRGTRTGSDNPMWKGGKTREVRRVGIRVGRDHPMADRNGLVMEHRLVMAAVLGRYLTSDEIVHHINEDPFDNTPENLVVVSRGQHLAIHCLLREGVDPIEAVRKVLA